MRQVELTIKRLVDISASFVALLLLAIPFVIIAVLIKRDSRGPVFFMQERVGKKGNLFNVWKFRTMVDGAVYKGLGYTVEKNDARITRVGKKLRDSGIDELPQLINVLIGNMSIVGPRPTLQYQVEHYNENQRRRLDMKPGITSLAVVSGRNALSWEERIKLDLEYIDKFSILLDFRIMFKTFWVVLVTREGLYGEDGINDPFVEPPKPESQSRQAEHVE